MIVAIDHEGGAVQRLIEAHGCARLPSARQVATDYTVAEAQAVYAEAGRAVARLGFNLNLAPVVDLENAGNPAIGHYGRAFSGDADTVTAYAGAFVRGFEASGVAAFLSISRVRAARKATVTSGRPTFPRSGPKPTSRPSGALSAKGVDAVMSGYSVLRTVASDGRPAALSREIVTGLLHGQLGFDGVAMTDDLDMGAVGYGFARRSAIVQALQAGNDALMVRNRKNYDPALPATIASWMSEALADGTLSIDALSKSADRVRRLRNKLNQLT